MNYSELVMIDFAVHYAAELTTNLKNGKREIPDPAKALSEWKLANKE